VGWIRGTTNDYPHACIAEIRQGIGLVIRLYDDDSLALLP
jgi:hypothetical protein